MFFSTTGRGQLRAPRPAATPPAAAQHRSGPHRLIYRDGRSLSTFAQVLQLNTILRSLELSMSIYSYFIFYFVTHLHLCIHCVYSISHWAQTKSKRHEFSREWKVVQTSFQCSLSKWLLNFSHIHLKNFPWFKISVYHGQIWLHAATSTRWIQTWSLSLSGLHEPAYT